MEPKTWDGWDIFRASSSGRIDIVRLLIEDQKEDPNIIDADGHRPIDYAIADDRQVVRVYLESVGGEPYRGITYPSTVPVQPNTGRLNMTYTIRFCDHCEASANDTDIRCGQCGSVLPPSSYESGEPVKSINWWKWLIGFDGRINRSGLWVRTVIYWIAVVGVNVISAATEDFTTGGLLMILISSLATIAAVVLNILMLFCGVVRRFHDRGKSGWSVLLFLIPFWGIVVSFQLYFLSGDPGSNKFGAEP